MQIYRRPRVYFSAILNVLHNLNYYYLIVIAFISDVVKGLDQNASNQTSDVASEIQVHGSIFKHWLNISLIDLSLNIQYQKQQITCLFSSLLAIFSYFCAVKQLHLDYSDSKSSCLYELFLIPMTDTISEYIDFSSSHVYPSLVRTDGILITTRPLCAQTWRHHPLVSFLLLSLVHIGKLSSRTRLSKINNCFVRDDKRRLDVRYRRSLVNTSTLDVRCETSYVYTMIGDNLTTRMCQRDDARDRTYDNNMRHISCLPIVAENQCWDKIEILIELASK